MKKNLLFTIILAMVWSVGYATKYTINNVGTTFSPATITIHVNDTVIFVLANAHNAIEVTKATYDANGNTSNGGFSVAFGGGTAIFHNAGVFYFVCEPHAAIGMKGIITVTAAAGIDDFTAGSLNVQIYPDPASNFIRIKYALDTRAIVIIRLVDALGRTVADILSETRESGDQEDTYEINKSFVKSNGIYFVKIQYGDHSFMKKVIIK